MTEAWPHKPYTFRALRKTFGAMWVRCDVCRRYATIAARHRERLHRRLGGLGLHGGYLAEEGPSNH
jgi:hypothetical protein